MCKHMRQLRVPVVSLQQTGSVLFSTLTEFDLRFKYKCSPNAVGSPQLRKGERLLFSANQGAPGRRRRDSSLCDDFCLQEAPVLKGLMQLRGAAIPRFRGLRI